MVNIAAKATHSRRSRRKAAMPLARSGKAHPARVVSPAGGGVIVVDIQGTVEALNRVVRDNTPRVRLEQRRIFIVDDHPIVRQGLTQLIESEPGLMVCGQDAEAFHSLKAIKEARPDLVLLDVSLKDGDGIELLKELRVQMPQLQVLMLSMHDESIYAERALRSGARGYVMKQEAPHVLLEAMRKVMAGEIYVSEKMNGMLLQRMVGRGSDVGALPMDRLTDREIEVFRMIGAGQRIRQIAEQLFLSVKTIEAHREHIKKKLNFNSSAELLRFALQNSPDVRG